MSLSAYIGPFSFFNNFSIRGFVYENKKLKIKSTPGFRIFMSLNQMQNELLIQVDDIDNISYIDHIHIYLDSSISTSPKSISSRFRSSNSNSLRNSRNI